MDFIKVSLTALLSVVSLFVITKIMGHKQVSQLDFFDYVSGITIGSIGAEMATELEKPYQPLIALAIYGAVSVLISLCTQRLPKTRKYINGSPSIMISCGKIHRDNLKKAKLDLSELLLLCREAGYFDLDEIEVAVFEHNGRLSILPKSANRPATPKDMCLAVAESEIGVEVILDGWIMGENLTRMGRNEKWLEKELRSRGYKGAKEIFLGVYRPKEDRLSLYPKE